MKLTCIYDEDRAARGWSAWRVYVPAKLSDSKKMKNVYFGSEKEGLSFIQELKGQVQSFIDVGLSAGDVIMDVKERWRVAGCSGDPVDLFYWVARQVESVGSVNAFMDVYERGRVLVEASGRSRSWLDCASEFLDFKIRIEKRRERTIKDLRNMLARVEACDQKFAWKAMCDLSVEDCDAMLKGCFSTARQRLKAKKGLSGVFSFAIKKGWCEKNVLSLCDVERVEECELVCLTVEECAALVSEARGFRDGVLLCGVTALLFCGIRPEEVGRLRVEDLDFEEGVVSVRSRSAKTGGARHVPMSANAKVLFREGLRFLDECEGMLVPSRWERWWQELRLGYGYWGEAKRWPQDGCRHTFASYFLKRNGDLSSLQVAMGHRSSALLLSRYLNMRGVTRESCDRFWRIGLS